MEDFPSLWTVQSSKKSQEIVQLAQLIVNLLPYF